MGAEESAFERRRSRIPASTSLRSATGHGRRALGLGRQCGDPEMNATLEECDVRGM